jgi:hypothetical protein
MLFQPGHKLSKGRPKGSRNKPVEGAPATNPWTWARKKRLMEKAQKEKQEYLEALVRQDELRRNEEQEYSPTFRRFRALLTNIVTDLGGEAVLPTAELQLAQRCAWISTQCEILEEKAAAAPLLELSAYATLTGHLTRTLTALGLKRQPRDVTPRLKDYLAAVRQPEPEDEEDTE